MTPFPRPGLGPITSPDDGEHCAAALGADVVVVNTCGFLDSARDESLDAIGEAMAENGRVIVTGCLGRDADLIREHHPNVLAVTGPQATAAVVDAVHEVAGVGTIFPDTDGNPVLGPERSARQVIDRLAVPVGGQIQNGRPPTLVFDPDRYNVRWLGAPLGEVRPARRARGRAASPRTRPAPRP